LSSIASYVHEPLGYIVSTIGLSHAKQDPCKVRQVTSAYLKKSDERTGSAVRKCKELFMKTNTQATGSNTPYRRALRRRDSLANTSLIRTGLGVGPLSWAEKKNKMTTRKLGKLEVSLTHPSVGASAEVVVYASWAEILTRMTYCSVGTDPRTVVQNKIHPAVAEPEFTPLDMSYMSR
jgi:hypothetical protein